MWEVERKRVLKTVRVIYEMRVSMFADVVTQKETHTGRQKTRSFFKKY